MKRIFIPGKFSYAHDKFHYSAAVETGPLAFFPGCTAATPGKKMPDGPEARSRAWPGVGKSVLFWSSRDRA